MYVLEVNPRASRTVPYVSKATGLQGQDRGAAWSGAACRPGRDAQVVPKYFSVKEAVFPFVKFPGVDTILGPEMKSTGEVMGVGHTFGEAFVKSQLGAGVRLPEAGMVFISVKNADKPKAVTIARSLHEMGFALVATKGTAAAAAAGVPSPPSTRCRKPARGRPAEERRSRWYSTRSGEARRDRRLALDPHDGTGAARDLLRRSRARWRRSRACDRFSGSTCTPFRVAAGLWAVGVPGLACCDRPAGNARAACFALELH